MLLLPGASTAWAECEDAEAGLKAANAAVAEQHEREVAQTRRMAEVRTALAQKAAELSWTPGQTDAFMKRVRQSPGYVSILARKDEEMAAIARLRKQLDAVRHDPIKVCTVGMSMMPPSRRLADLGDLQITFVLDRIAAAK